MRRKRLNNNAATCLHLLWVFRPPWARTRWWKYSRRSKRSSNQIVLVGSFLSMNKPLLINIPLVRSFLEELKFPHIPTSYYIFSFSKILRTTHEKSNRILRKVGRQTRNEGHSQNTKKNVFCAIPNLGPFKLAGLETPHLGGIYSGDEGLFDWKPSSCHSPNEEDHIFLCFFGLLFSCCYSCLHHQLDKMVGHLFILLLLVETRDLQQ